MKKTLVILLVLAMVFGLLAGCGGSDKEDTGSAKKGSSAPVAEIEEGTYLATYCEEDGQLYACDEDWLEIDADGTGVLVFEGDEYAMEWELSGGNFSFEDEDGSTFEGTYADGVIEGILDGSIEYVFELEGAKAEPAKKGAAAAEEEDVTGFEPVSAAIGDYEVTIVGAELFEDSENKDAIRVYWDFTNTSDETTYASCNLSEVLEQEGFELTSTYDEFEDDVPEYGNSGLNVRPGVTIRCISEYNCKADGDLISFTIYDWYDEEDSVTVEFDPMVLPGRPAQDLVIEPIADPGWTDGMPVEGAVEDGYVVIEGAEVVPGWGADEVVRVYFAFTNEGDEPTSMWMETWCTAYQDGIELESGWADEDVEEDELFSEDVEPGDSVRCSDIWELRSDSPIEIEISGWDNERIGIVLDPDDLRG